MARRLEEIHSQPGRQEPSREEQTARSGASRLVQYDSRSMSEEIFSGQELATAYDRAFQDYGIDMAVLPVEEAAELIRGRSIHLELARALDFWSSMLQRAGNPGPPDWKRLLAVATLTDADPWRNELRDALQGRDRKALEALAASADVRSMSPTTLHLLGNALSDLGAADHAVSLLRRAQRQYPGDLWLNDALGWLYYGGLRPAQFDESVRFYTAARAVRPLNPHMTYSIGRALLRKGSFADAIAEFTRAIELKPDLSNAWSERAQCYFELGQRESALVDYAKAIELNPKFAWPHTNLGDTLKDQNQLDEAIGEYRKAIEIDPKSAMAHTKLGNALRDKNQLDEAIGEHRKAIELAPRFAWAHNNLGVALNDNNQVDEAIREYRIAIEIDPNFAWHHNNLGICLQAKNQLDEAIGEHRKAVELDPTSAVAQYDLGRALKAKGDLEGAERAYRAAVRLDGKHHGAAIDALARLLLSRGNFEEAIATYQEIIILDPKSAMAHTNLGFALTAKKLEAKLADVLAGKATATDNAERLFLATLCGLQRRHVAAARLFADAFTAEAKLADDLKAHNRYSAAYSGLWPRPVKGRTPTHSTTRSAAGCASRRLPGCGPTWSSGPNNRKPASQKIAKTCGPRSSTGSATPTWSAFVTRTRSKS